ncbi:MAG: sigma-70 family RNA polymerase sigma factor [Clostridiales bacterium]|nr:sigma-70 family RNA polymerase sigma factor [Clostridiales bacterium]
MYDYKDILDLVKLAQNGDNDAKENLLLQNSPLIKSVIKRYIDKGIEYDDLYQLGSLGFLKAINNFDESHDVKFSTYAVPMIAGEVKRYLRDNGIIKVSRSVKSLNIQINKFISNYLEENNTSPNIDIIASNFDITPQEVIFAMESSRKPLSLFSVINDDTDNKNTCIIDKIANDDAENEIDKMLLFKELKSLTNRDRKIILLRYFRDMTQKEIADVLGVSQVQVSRLESKILNKLRDKIKSN